MPIEMVKVRAEITLGDLVAITPTRDGNHILSFNVERNRGQISTFNASIKAKSGEIRGTFSGSTIVIRAGTARGMATIFTGIVKSVNIGPCREDPGFIILNISGTDIMGTLEGKKFTRRCRSSKGVWVSIEGIVRPGLRSGRFQYVPGEPSLTTVGSDITQIGQITQTRQIPNPGNKTEKLAKSQHSPSEVSLFVAHVTSSTEGGQ